METEDNGLALDRCANYGKRGHKECFRVVKFRQCLLSTHDHPEVASHVAYGDALRVLLGVSAEEYQRLEVESEAWWNNLVKEQAR